MDTSHNANTRNTFDDLLYKMVFIAVNGVFLGKTQWMDHVKLMCDLEMFKI